MLDLEEKVLELEDSVSEAKKGLERLFELQMRHEHQDEVRAVKQDQLMANIQSLIGNLQNYQKDLHDMTIKNAEDIGKNNVDLAKNSTRIKILYAACAVIGGAILTGIFEWLPNILQLLSKGK